MKSGWERRYPGFTGLERLLGGVTRTSYDEGVRRTLESVGVEVREIN